MESAEKPRKNLQYYMRAIHRVLGYLAVGMVIVYAISGITLIHRSEGFMKRDVVETIQLDPDLTPDELVDELSFRHLEITDETDSSIIFTDGSYDKASGIASWVKKEYPAAISKFNQLHMLPVGKNKHIGVVTTIFGVVLLLLAITSLFMYKPKNKQFKANLIYIILGVILTVVLVLTV